MKSLSLLATVALTALIGLADPQTPDPSQSQAPQDKDLPRVQLGEGQRAGLEPMVGDLGFLSGTWRGGDGTSTWEAVYSSAEGGQLVAASKELKDGRVVMIDFEHFYEREGQLRLTPYPFGQRSVEFTLTKMALGDRLAVFENPEHDFPQRFTYQRTDDEHLRIELEGEMGGQSTSMVLEFERATE